MLNETALTVVRDRLIRLKEIREELANISMELGTALNELGPLSVEPDHLEDAIGAVTETIEITKETVKGMLQSALNESAGEEERSLYSTIEEELNV